VRGDLSWTKLHRPEIPSTTSDGYLLSRPVETWDVVLYLV
jgi:hypothetical protein